MVSNLPLILPSVYFISHIVIFVSFMFVLNFWTTWNAVVITTLMSLLILTSVLFLGQF